MPVFLVQVVCFQAAMVGGDRGFLAVSVDVGTISSAAPELSTESDVSLIALTNSNNSD